jgi:hypothetical protein
VHTPHTSFRHKCQQARTNRSGHIELMVFDGLVLGQFIVSSKSNSPPALVTRHVGVPSCSTRVIVYRLCVLHDLLEYLPCRSSRQQRSIPRAACKSKVRRKNEGGAFKAGVGPEPPLVFPPLLKELMTKQPRSFLYQQVCPEDPAA